MNLQNNFIVAMPSLQDPLFRQSVVYIFFHNNEGAMGIVINKPIEHFTIEKLLSNLKIIPVDRDPSLRLEKPVFLGGPLADDRGFIIHPTIRGFGSSLGISSQTMITTSRDILEAIGTSNNSNKTDNILVALGYSGWHQGQLEYELRENHWLTTPANSDILFRTPIASRWYEAAKILGIDIYNITNQVGHA